MASLGSPRLDHWGLTADRRRGLLLGELSLRELLDRHGSPLHVVDAARLARNADELLAVPEGAASGCDVFYSYKTNPVPGVLSFLHRRGIGAEVISPYEMWLALRLGVPPSRIVFNGPAKDDAALALAARHGVLVNINHREEIAAAAHAAREVGRRARVGLRVVTRGGWSGQLGFRIAGGEALAGFEEALRHPDLRVVGLHAHLGEPIRSPAELRRFLDELLDFTEVLRRRLGLELPLLDLGGGLASPTVVPFGEPPRAETLSLSDYVRLTVSRIEQHFRRCERPRPRIALEPGRALTGDAQLLLTRVVRLKATSRGHAYAMLDAGTNLASALRFESHHVLAVKPAPRAPRRRYTLAGPLCSPDDVLLASVRLPELRPGDALAIMDAGAYFVAYQTNFSFPRPAIVMVEGGSARSLRRAERFTDLTAFDSLADSNGDDQDAPRKKLVPGRTAGGRRDGVRGDASAEAERRPSHLRRSPARAHARAGGRARERDAVGRLVRAPRRQVARRGRTDRDPRR
jgi:diaminopimelate decarboxylase